jgi:ferrochelatase
MSERIGVLLMAYGTPRRPEDVEAYYTDIRRGRPPSADQLADLVRRYDAIGGTSPLAERTEAQRRAVQAALDTVAPGQFEVALGLKHASPKIDEGMAGLAARGSRVVVALVLAPHYSALSVGEYLSRVDAAARPFDIRVLGIEHWHLEPAYVEFLRREVQAELARLPPRTKVLFTAHSLPERILASHDPYPHEVRATAQAVAAELGLAPWSGWAVAWQSAGRTPEPWLGPDLLDVIEELAGSENADGVLVCACGFVADHLEVLYDLDVEARQRAERLGLAFGRAPCVNDDGAVMDALARLIVHRAGVATTTGG